MYVEYSLGVKYRDNKVFINKEDLNMEYDGEVFLFLEIVGFC